MRSIDADALEKYLLEHGFYPALVKAAIKKAPSVDAESVVHCKDCRYWQDNNGGYPNKECRWREDETPDADDFCSCGERKEVIDDGNQQENA